MKPILVVILLNIVCVYSLAQSTSSTPITDNSSIFDDKPGAKKTTAWPKIFSSQQGFFNLSIEPINVINSAKIIPMRTLHRWKIHITNSDGKPVSGARVLLDGGMPAHAHGLPSVPKVKPASSNGDYIIDGIKFNMGGEWLLRFTIIHEQKDRAQITFELAH